MPDPLTIPPGFEPIPKTDSQSTVPPSPAPGLAIPPGFAPMEHEPTPTPTTPSTGGKDKERSLDLSLGAEAIENFVPSLVKNVGDLASGVGSMVMHPVETAKTMSKLGASLTPLAMGVTAAMPILQKIAPETAQKLDSFMTDLNAPKQAIIDDYIKAYGGKQAFYKTLATDPVRLLTDLATVATGGEAALAKVPQAASMISKAGKLGEVTAKAMEASAPALEKVAHVATYADPLKLAGAAVSKGADTAMGALNMSTGVGSGVMQEALRTGFEGGEAGANFRRGMSELPTEEVVGLARQGYDTMKQRMFADFQADKDVWSKSNARLNFDKLDNAELAVHNDIVSQTGNRLKFKASDADVAKINKILETVDQWRKDPQSHTLLGFDDLKQAIRNQIDFKNDSKYVTSAATKMANAAKDTAMTAADPRYRKSLRNYELMSDKLHDVERAFSLDSDNLHTTMSKLQSVMRNNASTQYGMRKGAAQTLKDESGVDILPMLAGHAASSWTPRGITRPIMAGASWPTAMGAAFLGHPAALGAAGIASLAASPKLMAGTLHGLGRIGGLPGQLYGALPKGVRDVTTPLLRGATSQPSRNAIQTLERDQPAGGYAFGGRVRFDEGGDVGDSLPMPALRGAVNASLTSVPKVVDPVATILARKIAPSQMLRGEPVRPPAPPSTAPTDNSISDALKTGADQWNKRVQKQDDDKLAQQLKDMRAQIAAAAAGTASAPSGGSPAESVAPAGSAPVATPLAGDSYEAKVGKTESGGRDDAVNPTTGTAGRFQFMPSTAEGIRKEHPELGISDSWRTNAADQQKLMKVYTDQSREILRKQLGREPTGGELYMLHFLGHAGGPRVLSQLDKPMSEITTQAERAANPILNRFGTGKHMLDYYNTLFG